MKNIYHDWCEKLALLSGIVVVTGSLYFLGHLLHSHSHAVHVSHYADVDVPFGVFTPREIARLESFKPDSSLSSKTPPAKTSSAKPSPEGIGVHGDESQLLTFVVDFIDPEQSSTSDIFGNQVGPLDLGEYGFSPAQFSEVRAAIIAEANSDFTDELAGTEANLPENRLRINIIEGDIGTPPPGIDEFYFIQVGSAISGPQTGSLGVAGLSVARNPAGQGPNSGIEIGDVVGSVFADNLQNLAGLTPFNALSSGNLEFTVNVITGTTSHEIGHTVSLSHANSNQSMQPTQGAGPIMGTGAIDLSNQARLSDREFSLAGMNEENGNAPIFHVDQLVGSLGLTGTGPVPNSAFNVLTGTSEGELADFGLIDGESLLLQINEPTLPNQPAISMELTSVSPIVAPGSLQIRFQTVAATPNVMQRIEVFNLTTNQFDLVDERQTPTLPANIVFSIEGAPTDYINPDTCEIQSRIQYIATGPVLTFPWNVRLDFFRLINAL